MQIYCKGRHGGSEYKLDGVTAVREHSTRDPAWCSCQPGFGCVDGSCTPMPDAARPTTFDTDESGYSLNYMQWPGWAVDNITSPHDDTSSSDWQILSRVDWQYWDWSSRSSAGTWAWEILAGIGWNWEFLVSHRSRHGWNWDQMTFAPGCSAQEETRASTAPETVALASTSLTQPEAQPLKAHRLAHTNRPTPTLRPGQITLALDLGTDDCEVERVRY